MTARAAPGLGLLKGLGVTIRHMLRPAVTRQYPHVKPDLAPRTRGVIALMEENCTVCMLCARECPDWCIYIDSHKETIVTDEESGRTRTRNELDRFAIDYALCMYCGICVEVCPFDALFWSPEFEYSEYSIEGLLHEAPRLREWMDTVPAPPPLDEGAAQPAEVSSAVDKARKAQEQARQQRQKALEEAASPRAKAGAPAPKKAAAEPEVHVEEVEVDQEIYQRLLDEGLSERIARAKAKAAFVRRRKAELREQARQQAAETDEEEAPEAGEAPEEMATGAAAPAEEEAEPEAPEPEASAQPAEPEVEAGEIDQETYDRLIAEGASERVARAKAKRAWVVKRRRELREGGG